MALTLSPELEQRIQGKLDSGEYGTLDQMIGSALDILDDDRCGMSVEEFNAAIEEGWQAAERGDVLTPEESRADLARFKAELQAESRRA